MKVEKNNTFLINKKDFSKTTYAETAIPFLREDEVLLQINKYAFTANNITYALFGERIYWQFFPVSKKEGIIPVWGYAEVVASRNEAIKAGMLCYGYFPMSDFLKVQPSSITESGFIDNTAHRQQLPAVYNHITYLSKDKSYQEKLEDYIPLVRPLFATAFLNYHFLKKNKFYKSKQVVLTSASSKTALGLAYLLRKHNKKNKLKRIIGITSKSNVAFVKKTGFYDEVITYDDYRSLKKEASILVDFAGNIDLIQGIEKHLGNSLNYISLIGFTDWEEAIEAKKSKGVLFFAPEHAEKIQKEWGNKKLSKKLGKGLLRFIKKIKKSISIEYVVNEKKAIEKLYLKTLKGEAKPSKGYIVVRE